MAPLYVLRKRIYDTFTPCGRFELLRDILADLPIKADQGSVDRLISLCAGVIDKFNDFGESVVVIRDICAWTVAFHGQLIYGRRIAG